MPLNFLQPFVVVLLIVVALLKTAKVVPQRSAFVVERLGKYYRTLQPGLYFLIPIVDKPAYKQEMRMMEFWKR